MAAEQRHVPKFGSWDSDNVPYTAYFEKARKEKPSKIINPNDPEENPEAFGGSRPNTSAVEEEEEENRHGGVVKRRNVHHRRNNAGNNSGNTGENQRQTKKYFQQRSMEESGNFVLSSPGSERYRSAGNPYDDHSYISAASVPKFGAWDETDANSGDGFTVIFNRVKEEKQIAASRLPPSPPTSTITPPHPAVKGGRNNSTSITSKILSCCLVPKAKGS